MDGLRNDGGLPPGLDPDEYPVIATHVYGWRRVGEVTAEIVNRLASRRGVDDHDQDAAA